MKLAVILKVSGQRNFYMFDPEVKVFLFLFVLFWLLVQPSEAKSQLTFSSALSYSKLKLKTNSLSKCQQNWDQAERPSRHGPPGGAASVELR